MRRRAAWQVAGFSWLVIGLVCCGGRGLPASGTDATRPGSELGPVQDSGIPSDLQSFCSGPSTLVYENTSYAVTRTQMSVVTFAAPSYHATNHIGIEAVSSAGKPTRLLFGLSSTDPNANLTQLDLAHLPGGVYFSVSRPPSDPYYPVWEPAGDVYDGYARLEPMSAVPGCNLTLCLSARLKAYEDINGKKEHMVSLRLWATGPAKITPCVSKYDYLCGDGMGAALVGTCNEDGTCTCLPGHAKSVATGRCAF